MWAADLDVFVNLEEFAEEIEIEGERLAAQVIRNTSEKSGRQSENWGGLHGDFVTIYFVASDYSRAIPHQGQWLRINGKRYDVIESAVELGIAKIICAAYRQNIPR